MRPLEILRLAFLAGAADLDRRVPLLNQINVFPVMDADTGVNMTQTLAMVTRRLERGWEGDFAQLSEEIGQLLLKGARGNSGVIFAQFLVGLFQTMGELGEFTHDSFSKAVENGKNLAYQSVAKPVDGTILTVMTELAQIMGDYSPVDDLEAHAYVQRRLAESVACTQELLPQLKEAGVVDAGALGFYIFVSSLIYALPALNDLEPALTRIEDRCSGKEEAPLGTRTETIARSYVGSARERDTRFRYCINMLVELLTDLPQDWAVSLDKMGSSIDMARSGSLVKLHLHSNDIEAARRAGEQLGKILQFSTDDMSDPLVRPVADPVASSADRVELRVVSDSSMSLGDDLVKELGIGRIENYVNVHNRMVQDPDLDRKRIFLRMRQGYVFTTAQTSASEIGEFFDRWLKTSEQLIYVAVGNAYTGTQALVRKVASQHPEKDRIYIVDSRAASGQQGLVCLTAARRAALASDLNELVAYVNNQVSNCREYLVIDDLRHLRRTGRISLVKATLAGALSLKPIVGHGDNGAVTHAKVRTHEAAVHAIVERVLDHPGEGRLVVMLEHTDEMKWVTKVEERLRVALPRNTEFVSAPLSSTSAVHMGPGTWGVAVIRVNGEAIG